MTDDQPDFEVAVIGQDRAAWRPRSRLHRPALTTS
jgi:hypothetical protein